MALEKLDENQTRALWNNEVMQNQRKLHHDSLRKKVKFQPCILVMLVDSWLMKCGQKFIPKWKGLYVIHQQFLNGAYTHSSPNGSKIIKPQNRIEA